jgi:transposase, IS5 family
MRCELNAKQTEKRGRIYLYFNVKFAVNQEEMAMMNGQFGFFDLANRYEQLSSHGDPLEKLLDDARGNENKVWADGAYFSEEQEARLEEKGYVSRILNRTNRTKKFPEHSAIARENRRRSKIRKRVEHVFGFIQNSMHGKFIRTIGMARAKAKIGLMNLVYNVCRYEQLCRIGAS